MNILRRIKVDAVVGWNGAKTIRRRFVGVIEDIHNNSNMEDADNYQHKLTYFVYGKHGGMWFNPEEIKERRLS